MSTTDRVLTRPRGLLFDYGGTLVEEVSVNTRAGTNWLLRRANSQPGTAEVERILERVKRVSVEVSSRRDEFHIETPWPSLTRLVYDISSPAAPQNAERAVAIPGWAALASMFRGAVA